MKQLFKKTTSVLLVLVMICSLLPLTVMAESVKTAERAETGMNNGPSDFYAYIDVSLVKGDRFSTQIFSVEDDVLQPYEDKVVYDRATNTLTLNNLSAYALDINEMGSDLKINVKGYNSLNYITVWGYGWGGSAFITGDGTLDLQDGIGLEAENSYSVLTIDKDVTVMTHDSGFYVAASTAETQIVVKGRELSGGTPGRPQTDWVVLPHETDLSWTDTVQIYRNTTKPFADSSVYHDAELFAVVGLSAKETRADDGLKHRCYKFSISEVVEKDGAYYIGGHPGYLYAWDDSLVYKLYENNLDSMQISDIDPNYVKVDMHSTNESMVTMCGKDGRDLNDIAIVPLNSDALSRPTITTKELPDATDGKAYSATVTAKAANSGGRIVGFSLEGTASKWLTIDSSGKLSGKAPAYGVYQAIVTATEEVNGKRTTSPMEAFVIKVGLPDNVVTFGRSVSDGAAHKLTVTKRSDGSVVRTYSLGTKDITPAYFVNLGTLPDGNYTVAFTGESTGAEVTYDQNTADFTVKDGKSNIITLSLSANIIYSSGTLVVKIPNIAEAEGLTDLTAVIELNNGKQVRRSVSRTENILPHILVSTTVKRVSLTARDATGQEFEIGSGNGDSTAYVTVNVDPDTFRSYTFSCYAKGVSNIVMSYNGNYFKIDGRDEYLFKKASDNDEIRFESADKTDAAQNTYNFEVEPTIFVSSYSGLITLSFPSISRTGELSGTVADGEGNPIAGATVNCNQMINGSCESNSAVTDKNGEYTVKKLVKDVTAHYTVRAAGYITVSGDTDPIGEDTPLDIDLEQQHELTVIVDREVFDAELKLSGAVTDASSGLSGSRFSVPLEEQAEGKVTVTLTASNIAGSVTGETVIADGRGVIRLSPTTKGLIDWSGYDAQGREIGDYNGYDIRIKGGDYQRTFPANGIKAAELAPGTYTVSVMKPGTETEYAQQQLTVRSDETAYLTVALPEEAAGTGEFSGRLSGPKTVTAGSAYKLSGLVTSIDGSEIEYLRFQKGDSMSWSYNVENVVINGKPAAVQNGYVYPGNDLNKAIDWSLPMNITVYCTQGAGASSAYQTVSAYIKTNKTESVIGSVTTRYVPNLTLYTPERVGAKETYSESGMKYYEPKPVAFTGKTTPNTEVLLYDNDEIAAAAVSDKSGNYSGSLTLLSSAVSHTIRAEATLNGNTATATSTSSYDPVGAILKSLSFNGKNIPIDGGSFAYTVVPTSKAQFAATFENQDALDDLTYTIDGEEVTSKVFFEVKSVGATKLLAGKLSSDSETWKSDQYAHGAEYPTGVKVIYRSKPAAASTVTYIDENGKEETVTVDRALARLTDSAGNTKFITVSGSVANTAETGRAQTGDNNTESSANTLYGEFADAMNGDGEEICAPITAKQATEKCPENCVELRTFNDAPEWPVNERDFALKKQELEQKGYTVVSSKDEKTGHTIFLFKGSFYYDATAKPVPDLYVTNVYNGIQKCEEDPRMIKDGKVLGSTLDVIYMCDYNAKKWTRTQTAIIPADAMSPIHTTSTQIPCKTDAPIKYSAADISPISMADQGDARDIASTGVYFDQDNPAGFRVLFKINPKDVSCKTYTQFAISATSYGVSKYAGSKINDMPFEGFEADVKKEFISDLNHIADMAGADAFYVLGNINEELNIGGDTFKSSMGMASKYMQDNMRYWGTVKEAALKTDAKNNGGPVGDYSGYAAIADMMIRNSRDMANELVNFEAAVERAGIQNELSAKLSECLGSISLILAVGGQPEFALLADFVNFMVQAANDTNNAELIEGAKKVKEQYDKLVKYDQDMKKYVNKDEENVKKAQAAGNKEAKTIEEITGKKLYDPFNPNKEYGDIDNKTEDDTPADNPGGDNPGGDNPGGDNPGGSNPGGTNPGGSNPGGSNPGGSNPGGTPGGRVSPTGSRNNHSVHAQMQAVHDPSGVVYEAVLSNPVAGAEVSLYRYDEDSDSAKLWDDSAYLNQANPLTSDESGYYRWDVPEGEWYVTAVRDGYAAGSSQNDKAATVKHGDTAYLPVLPPQLEVNIPLVSYAAPEVESAAAKSDGVYITFTKYMNEADLQKASFILTDASGKAIDYTLTKLDSEQAPANIDYGGTAPRYTRTVKLAASLDPESALSLTVKGGLRSYADVPMTAPYSDSLTVEKKAKTAAPEFSVKAGEIEKGTLVTMTCADGAEIIYTTDGTVPSATNGVRVSGGAQVSLIIDTTLKAIAVQTGYADSSVAAAEYTIRSAKPVSKMLLGDTDGDNDVTIVDATMIQRYLVNLPTSSFFPQVSDTDGDGDITIVDATAIQRYLAQLSCPDGIGQPV